MYVFVGHIERHEQREGGEKRTSKRNVNEKRMLYCLIYQISTGDDE